MAARIVFLLARNARVVPARALVRAKTVQPRLLVAQRTFTSRAFLRKADESASQPAEPKDQPEDSTKSSQESTAQKDESENSQESTEQKGKSENSLDYIKETILQLALEKVPELGWSIEALTAAAQDLGYPEVAHGLFPGGPTDLIEFHIRRSHQQVVEFMQTSEFTELRTTEKIRQALRKRLELQQRVIKQWPQAMAILAQPENISLSIQLLGKFADDVWYHAGDKSVDFNWYTKRVMLAGVYASSELFMLQDVSPDFSNTFEFVDRRLQNVASFGTLTTQLRDMTSFALKTANGIVYPHKK